MKYFLKRCGFQELGSVGEDGKAKRGRYLMSSLHNEVVSFFPPLTRDIPNDTAILAVVPLYLGKKTFCSYVYHNSKFTGTKAKHPRNEYRIYLNEEVEGHIHRFSAGDIVVFRKGSDSAHSNTRSEEDFYYVDVISNHSSSTYLRLSMAIEEYPINGGYGILEGVINEFETKVAELENSQYTADVYVDESVIDRINKSTEKNKENIFNAATFRDFVLAGYGNACAVTGQKINGYMGEGLDVVYIRPREDGGTCMPNNGIPLERGLSMAFVQGKFTLSNDYEVVEHPSNDLEMVKKYRGKQIRVPHVIFFRPSLESIEYHRKFIFGSFANDRR